MDKAYVKDNHLYLEYEYFSPTRFSNQKDEKIIPLERINYIEEKVGPKGGDHGWDIRSKEAWEITTYDKTIRYHSLAEFGSRHKDLLSQVEEIAKERGIEIKVLKESGGYYL